MPNGDAVSALLARSRGGHFYKLNETGKVFAISGSGAPTTRPATLTDTNFLLAAVATASSSGHHPDEPSCGVDCSRIGLLALPLVRGAEKTNISALFELPR